MCLDVSVRAQAFLPSLLHIHLSVHGIVQVYVILYTYKQTLGCYFDTNTLSRKQKTTRSIGHLHFSG